MKSLLFLAIVAIIFLHILPASGQKSAKLQRYCSKYEQHFSFWCKPSKARTNLAKTRRFCSAYFTKCFGSDDPSTSRRSSQTSRSSQRRRQAQSSTLGQMSPALSRSRPTASLSGTRLASVKESESLVAGTGDLAAALESLSGLASDMASLCAKYQDLGDRFCANGAAGVPAEFQHLCRAYQAGCKDGPQDPAGSMVERECEANRAMAREFCYNGTPLPTAMERKCLLYRSECMNEVRARTEFYPFPGGKQSTEAMSSLPDDNITRMRQRVLGGRQSAAPLDAMVPMGPAAGRGYNDHGRYQGPAGSMRDGFGPRKSMMGFGDQVGIGVGGFSGLG